MLTVESICDGGISRAFFNSTPLNSVFVTCNMQMHTPRWIKKIAMGPNVLLPHFRIIRANLSDDLLSAFARFDLDFAIEPETSDDDLSGIDHALASGFPSKESVEKF